MADEIKSTKAQEYKYYQQIKRLVLTPLQSSIVARLKRTPPHADLWQTQINKAFTDPEYIDRVVEGSETLSNNHIDVLSAWHKKKIDIQFRQMFGIDIIPLLNEGNTQAFLNPIIDANIGLIKSIPATLLDQVNEEYKNILRTEGFRQDKVLDMLTKRFGVSQSRAKLISTDQTGKTIGALNGFRQQDAGVDSYIWRSSEDQRVRPEHILLNGTIHRWDRPIPGVGYPGQPIRCRCVAIPYIPGI